MTLALALKCYKNCSSGISFVPFGCSVGQILVQKVYEVRLRMHKPLVQGKLLIPSVKNALSLCSMFCSCSLVTILGEKSDGLEWHFSHQSFLTTDLYT